MKIPNLASRNHSGTRYPPNDSQSAVKGPEGAAFMRASCRSTAGIVSCALAPAEAKTSNAPAISVDAWRRVIRPRQVRPEPELPYPEAATKESPWVTPLVINQALFEWQTRHHLLR